MNQEKIMIIHKRLKQDDIVTFRLYNALYQIVFFRGQFSIHQEGISIFHTYNSLKELFEKYVIYGISLIDTLDDIYLI